ncbi:UNKNOWN [Stylonychia lemnae]|uniref:Uncharacterized protein n=1 Tax=Stylonychia lemnae TaxID=5949 RepID=A0A078B8Y1_STYLE|nr:UNKNOWN [Stylonychia lemnae]|eukprot:CDW90691.1 UNKNOWN [Stylonychia lemnae]
MRHQELTLQGQVTKCTWWMPWRYQAMKDVVACEKLRGAGKQALIRRQQTWRTETSKYPEEKKSTEIPKVVASEMGRACKIQHL